MVIPKDAPEHVVRKALQLYIQGHMHGRLTRREEVQLDLMRFTYQPSDTGFTVKFH
jgi:hypothetical protein